MADSTSQLGQLVDEGIPVRAVNILPIARLQKPTYISVVDENKGIIWMTGGYDNDAHCAKLS